MLWGPGCSPPRRGAASSPPRSWWLFHKQLSGPTWIPQQFHLHRGTDPPRFISSIDESAETKQCISLPQTYISTWMLSKLFLHNISEISFLSLELPFFLKQTILLIESLKFKTTGLHLTCPYISSSVILFPPLCHPPKSCINPA